MQLRYDGPMQGVGQRSDVQPQPTLRWCDRAGETEQSAQSSPSPIKIARARRCQIVRATGAADPVPGRTVQSKQGTVLRSFPGLRAWRKRTFSRECEASHVTVPHRLGDRLAHAGLMLLVAEGHLVRRSPRDSLAGVRIPPRELVQQ